MYVYAVNRGMRIDKTIKGEKFCYYVQFIPNTMTVSVRYFQSDEPIIGKISDDFKWIILPDDYKSPYISGIGKVAVKKLKLERQYQADAKDYNSNDMTATNKQLQFLFWIEVIPNHEKAITLWIILDCPKGVTTAEQAEAHLEENVMQHMMDSNDWTLVNNYKVTEVGYDLKKPEQKKKEKEQKKEIARIEQIETDTAIQAGDSQDVQIQKTVLLWFKDTDDDTIARFIQAFVYYKPNPTQKVKELIEKFMDEQGIKDIYLNHYMDIQAPSSSGWNRSSMAERHVLTMISNALLNLAFNRYKYLVLR